MKNRRLKLEEHLKNETESIKLAYAERGKALSLQLRVIEQENSKAFENEMVHVKVMNMKLLHAPLTISSEDIEIACSRVIYGDR
ncbi:MAG: hypothetical protein NTX05_02480 [Fusobacteria bacterium]|nr:hypothetical protein [Fusobacteriota bacterium]